MCAYCISDKLHLIRRQCAQVMWAVGMRVSAQGCREGQRCAQGRDKDGYAGQFVSTQGCPEGRCKCVSTCVCVCAPLATRHLWLCLQELGLVRQQAWREREGYIRVHTQARVSTTTFTGGSQTERSRAICFHGQPMVSTCSQTCQPRDSERPEEDLRGGKMS